MSETATANRAFIVHPNRDRPSTRHPGPERIHAEGDLEHWTGVLSLCDRPPQPLEGAELTADVPKRTGAKDIPDNRKPSHRRRYRITRAAPPALCFCRQHDLEISAHACRFEGHTRSYP